MKHLVIVAPTIKTGGGKELLLYLIEYLQTHYTQTQVELYIDKSLQIENSPGNFHIVYVSNAMDTLKLYGRHFSNALYFGNLPPYRKTTNSAVYFHNRYLLLPLAELFSLPNSKLIYKIKNLIRQAYVRLFIKNVDFVACQNSKIQQQFISKYGYKNVKVLPFFRICDEAAEKTDKIFDFCYISLAHPHKNHLTLFKALEILAKQNIEMSIALTIEDDNKELIEKIEQINAIGSVKIVNFGVVPKEKACNIYKQSRCLVFPSTSESFGLPLIEASKLGLCVISSNLPYTFEVVKPSRVFNPTSAEDIAEKMKESLDQELEPGLCLVDNELDKLIKKLIKIP